MRRAVRRLGALLALTVLVAGVPVALVLLGGSSWPDSLTWSAVPAGLLRPDDGKLLAGLLTLVAWGAWAVFALSVAVEFVSAVTGYRLVLRIPGLAAPQRWSAGLLTAALAVAPTVSSTSASAEPPTPSVSAVPSSSSTTQDSLAERPPPPSLPIASVRAPNAPAASRGEDPSAVRHRVEPGDDLWSLAERYYGTGRDWRRIAAANPNVLTGGPDRIEPGWRLVIPGVAAAEDNGSPTVTVRKGDTLSAIAERTLGDDTEWPRLYRANRSQLHDPDELSVGVELVVPENTSGEGHPPGRRADKTANTGGAEGPATSRQREDQSPAKDVPPPAPPTAARPRTSTPATRSPLAPAGPAGDRPPVPGIPPDAETSSGAEATTVVLGVSGVGALLAAGLISGLAVRRRSQLQARPLGRRILHPSPPAQQVEAALGRHQPPLGLRSLDLALRALSAHCLRTAAALPKLSYVRVADDRIDLLLSEEATPPPGFSASGRLWSLEQHQMSALRRTTDLGD
ncbi:MAG: LysM peptidoglycan-binding domain-containing protein, partial [Actinomycetes bacterium]